MEQEHRKDEAKQIFIIVKNEMKRMRNVKRSHDVRRLRRRFIESTANSNARTEPIEINVFGFYWNSL